MDSGKVITVCALQVGNDYLQVCFINHDAEYPPLSTLIDLSKDDPPDFSDDDPPDLSDRPF